MKEVIFVVLFIIGFELAGIPRFLHSADHGPELLTVARRMRGERAVG